MASSARIDELRKKFEENPRRYFAPLANEYRKAGDTDQAIAICREYLPQQPGHMSGHIVFGQALYEARSFEEAKSVFETALTLDPENLIALRHLGDISLMLSDTEGARAWYRRVLEADPRNEEIQAQLASLDQAASSAVTPAVGAPAGTPPSAPAAKPTPSSAPTVVLSAVPRPGSPAREPAEPDAPVTAVSPTAEIVLEDIVPPAAAARSPLPPTVEIDATGVPPEPEAADAPAIAPVALGIEPSSLASPLDVPGTAAAAPLEGLEATAAASDAAPMDSFSLDGLETTSLAAPAPVVEPAPPAVPELDLDIPAGPSAAAEASPPPMAVQAAEPGLDLDLGSLGAPSAPPEPPASAPADIPPLDFDVPAAAPPQASAPAEPEFLDLSLPEPASPVTADAGPVTAPAPPSAPEPAAGSETAGSPFVTETMAELYLQQGHREEALHVYRQLLEQRPDDPSLRDKVAALSSPAAAPAAATPSGGPSIRQVLRLIAMRRPGYRPEPLSQNGAAATAAPTEPLASPAPVAPSAAPSPQQHAPMADGLGAHFGFGSPAAPEEGAALALAAAFAGNGASPEGPGGRPARAAAGELSLDSVFGGEQQAAPPERNFSFDQFFSARASAEHPVPGIADATPASESAHDVAQFNQWLEGLKGR